MNVETSSKNKKKYIWQRDVYLEATVLIEKSYRLLKKKW